MKHLLKLSFMLLAILLPATVTATQIPKELFPPEPKTGLHIISFADDDVKAICVEHWDTDGDGELSEEEAAAVTSLEGAFDNSMFGDYDGIINSFDELVYFTGLTSIEDGEFAGCSFLSSITIPSGVTSIGYGAFDWCMSLTSLTIPLGVISIGDFAFNGCSGLTSLTIPSGVNTIGNYVFQCCSGLTSLTIPSGVTSIGDGAFSCCYGLTSVTIPNLVTSIGNETFSDCSSLTTMTIPNSVTSIGDRAFSGCSGLTSVTIPNLVTSIGNETFSDCSSLTTMTIPNSVTSIGDCPFSGCSRLTSIIVETGNTVYDSRDKSNAIIETARNTLITACMNTIIPNSVISIGTGAFSGFSDLTSIIIPNSITSIGEYAFSGCCGLTSVSVPNSVISIGDGAFSGCFGLVDVSIPNSVISIGDHAFSGCSGLTSVSIPNSVISIGDGAFSGCFGLVGVSIPNSVISIGNHAFSGCSGLTSVSIPNSVISIESGTFSGCNGLTSVSIPNSVTSIGDYAFNSCCGLTRLIIPNSVKSIGFHAFYECSSLTSIYMSNSVTSIGGYAFYNCSGLTSITIPNSVTSIEGDAFFRCSGLIDVYCFIDDPSKLNIWRPFDRYPSNYEYRTLHVPMGTLDVYYEDTRWSQYFGRIVEMGPMVATSIELNKSAALMEPGDNLQLMAELQPIEAIYNEVIWGSNNPEVATVSNDGLVTAVNVGTATITAMTTDGSNLSASCTVTVYTEMMGDVDGNGSVNISDVTALVDYLLNGDASAIVLSNADCDGNGAVNISDVTLLIDYLLTGHWQEEPEPTPEVTSLTVNGVTFKMVTIEGGTFTMGATAEQGNDALDREKPAHQVTLSSYRIGETEVTQELWVAVMGSNPSNFSSRNGYTENLSLPVEYVSWNSCKTFISKLNELTGEHFRLPTEAEWEFAARGGTRSMGFKYAGSNDIDAVAWYKDNSNSITHTVGSKAPNELGLYDMSGNVWEWCQDWFDNYSSSAQTDPTGPATGTICVYRGGGWSNSASYSRVSSRSGRNPTNVFINIGLRLALDSDDTVTPSEDEEYVDLGLPSGILWATKNIGAMSPEDYGDYFEISNEWISDCWANRPEGLQKTYGNNWPSKKELEELVNECTWTWTTRNSVNGYKVTGPNGKSIFLPAAGHYYYEDLDTLTGVGSACEYWSGTIGYVPMGGSFGHMYCIRGYDLSIDICFNRKPVRQVRRN